MFWYKCINSTFFTNTLHDTKRVMSTCGNTCAQLLVSDMDFVALYPMRGTNSYFTALKEFAKEVGALETLICDSQPTQKKCKVRDFCHQIGTTLHILEANTQWADHAGLYVGLVKEATQRTCG